jgi:hypothetical protein
MAQRSRSGRSKDTLGVRGSARRRRGCAPFDEEYVSGVRSARMTSRSRERRRRVVEGAPLDHDVVIRGYAPLLYAALPAADRELVWERRRVIITHAGEPSAHMTECVVSQANLSAFGERNRLQARYAKRGHAEPMKALSKTGPEIRYSSAEVKLLGHYSRHKSESIVGYGGAP